MKKILITLSLVLACSLTYAQDDDEKEVYSSEISTNLFDLVVAGSLNVNYEHLMEGNQSFLVGLTAFDTYGYYDAGSIEETNVVSLRAAWVIYTSKSNKHGGFHFYPLLKLRTGDVTPDNGFGFFDNNGDFIESPNESYDVGGFAAGFGLGYKWVVNNKFTLSINGELTRNLGKDLKTRNADLSNVEPRFGVNFGYRF